MKNLILAVAGAVLIAMTTSQLSFLDMTVSRGIYLESVIEQAADYGKKAVSEGTDIDTVQKNVDEYLDKALKNTGRTYRAEVVKDKSGNSIAVPVER